MAGKFEIYKDSEDEYRFRLRSRSGEVVANGESYPTKDGVKRGIAAVLLVAAGAKLEDKSGDTRV